MARRHYIFIVGQPSAKTLGVKEKGASRFLNSIPLPLFSGLCFQRILAWLPHKMKQNVVRVSFGFERTTSGGNKDHGPGTGTGKKGNAAALLSANGGGYRRT